MSQVAMELECADQYAADVNGGGFEETRKKEALDWMEWGRGWLHVVGEFFFQRISASHLENHLTLPHLDGISCIVTGSTSGIGLEIARQLAEAGAHVVMAVRRTNLAHELIQKWQNERQGLGLSLNVEVMELDLLSLESVMQFAEAWNARQAALHALINNAGIFSLGGDLVAHIEFTVLMPNGSNWITSHPLRQLQITKTIGSDPEIKEWLALGIKTKKGGGKKKSSFMLVHFLHLIGILP